MRAAEPRARQASRLAAMYIVAVVQLSSQAHEAIHSARLDVFQAVTSSVAVYARMHIFQTQTSHRSLVQSSIFFTFPGSASRAHGKIIFHMSEAFWNSLKRIITTGFSGNVWRLHTGFSCESTSSLEARLKGILALTCGWLSSC